MTFAIQLLAVAAFGSAILFGIGSLDEKLRRRRERRLWRQRTADVIYYRIWRTAWIGMWAEIGKSYRDEQLISFCVSCLISMRDPRFDHLLMHFSQSWAPNVLRQREESFARMAAAEQAERRAAAGTVPS